MEIDPELKRRITYFAQMGLEMPENNLKQAMLIPSATAIPNPLGTAPGWWVEKYGKIIISLPGPPGELQPMWQDTSQDWKKASGYFICILKPGGYPKPKLTN